MDLSGKKIEVIKKNYCGGMWTEETLTATFIEFGIDFQHLPEGASKFSVAIVMLEDGQLELFPVEQVRFLEGIS